MSNWSWKVISLNKDQKFACSDNLGENILNKME